MNSRELSVYALIDIFNFGSYNNLTLKKLFAENKQLSFEEKAFITELVNGTLRNIIYIDYIINNFSKTKTSKMKPIILNILRISVYQLMFMNKIPVSAICNEAVKLAKKKKFDGLSGFVNAVLRNISRNKDNIKLPSEEKEPIKFLSIKYSYPEWIIKTWLLEMDYEIVKEICQANNLSPKISICVNTNKTNKQELKDIFLKEGIEFQDGHISENSLYIFKTKDISESEAFKKGYFHIMDESSMLAVECLAPKKGQTIFDVCSAPGGKSFYLAYLMQNKGQIFSRDIHSHKIELIENNKKRLGLNIINTQQLDASIFRPEDENKADAIILDVPCSGLGILRKKPDIKYNKSIEDIDSLVLIQRNILKACAKYVKKGGTMLYCTCTISKKENLENIQWFLENFDFELAPISLKNNLNIETSENGYIQILPNMFQTDGFFIAKLKRKF